MKAILIHGMGRTPVSMWLLAKRLTKAGFDVHCFAYSVTFEKFQPCLRRLLKFIEQKTAGEDYFVVTHSLGSVLIRSGLTKLNHPPVACFFLAPPTVACAAALRLAHRRWYRWLAGEMGQLLANQSFMLALPVPSMPTQIYAGTGGRLGKHAFFGDELNDGILKVSETALAGIQHQTVPSLHTFIMNNRDLTEKIIQKAGLCRDQSRIRSGLS